MEWSPTHQSSFGVVFRAAHGVAPAVLAQEVSQLLGPARITLRSLESVLYGEK